MLQLTPLDPATYGIDPLRRTVLGAAGSPSRVPDSLGLTIFGQTLAIWMEEGLRIGLGLVMLSFATRSFQHRD